jgi:hypothetical protein
VSGSGGHSFAAQGKTTPVIPTGAGTVRHSRIDATNVSQRWGGQGQLLAFTRSLLALALRFSRPKAKPAMRVSCKGSPAPEKEGGSVGPSNQGAAAHSLYILPSGVPHQVWLTSRTGPTDGLAITHDVPDNLSRANKTG